MVKKGGISPQEKDRVRVDQLLHGIVDSELMLLQLRERQRNPRNFLDLLAEIRVEEEHQQTGQRVSTRVWHVATLDKSTEAGAGVVEGLKTDFRALPTPTMSLTSQQALLGTACPPPKYG